MFTVENPAAVPSEPIWRLSVEQYHAMIQAGILTDNDPVELLEGWLVVKMPKNPRHRATMRIIREALENLLPDGWYVDTQEPITTTDSEPEPDVVIVRGNTRQYLDRHPGPEDIALVIEVSDATLQSDRTSKYRTYARANISIYWIVNLVESQIEVYTAPSGPIDQPNYGQRKDYTLSDVIPVMLEGTEIGASYPYKSFCPSSIDKPVVRPVRGHERNPVERNAPLQAILQGQCLMLGCDRTHNPPILRSLTIHPFTKGWMNRIGYPEQASTKLNRRPQGDVPT